MGDRDLCHKKSVKLKGISFTLLNNNNPNYFQKTA